MENALVAKHVNKSFQDGSRAVSAVSDFSFSFPDHGFYCIVGESGSGKSTLLSVLSSLLSPDSGEVSYCDNNIYKASDREILELRKFSFGYVFQENNLLEKKTALENMGLGNSCESENHEILKSFGLLDKANVTTSKLSSGEKQRLAIARCFARKCKVVFMDEPTANLDSANAKLVFQCIQEIAKESLCIVVTHDEKMATDFASVVLRLSDGRLISAVGENNEAEGVADKTVNETRVGILPTNYGWKSLWHQKRKTITGMGISMLAMIMVFLWSSLFFYTPSNAFSSALTNESAWAIPLYSEKLNEPTQEIVTTSSGENLLKTGENDFNACVPYMMGRISKALTNVFMFPFSEDMVIGGVKVTEPLPGECVVSSFLERVDPNESTVMVSNQFGNDSIDLVHKDVIDVDFDTDVLDMHLGNPVYQTSHSDVFLEKYCFMILNASEFYSLHSQFSFLRLPGSSFLASSLSLRQYATSSIVYSEYNGEPLLFGDFTGQREDVAVSTKYLSLTGVKPENYRDIVGQEFALRDLSSSPNSVLYEGTPNLYEIVSKVKVTAIVEGDDSFVYVSHGLYGDIAKKLSMYSGGVCALNISTQRSANILAQGKLKSRLQFLQPVYQIWNLKNSSFSYVLGGFGVVLIGLSALSSISMAYQTVLNREKEIALLKTLGYGNFDIASRFAGAISLIEFIVFSCATLLSIAGVFGINIILKSKDVLGISYELFHLSFLPIFIVLICTLLLTAGVCLTLFKRLDKIQISEVFRGKN